MRSRVGPAYKIIGVLAAWGIVVVAGCSGVGADSDARRVAATSSPSPTGTSGDHRFVITYKPAKTKELQGAADLLRNSKALENSAEVAEYTFKLPRDIPVRARECGDADAHWSGETKDITICYEMLGLLAGAMAQSDMQENPKQKPDPKELGQKATGAMAGIFYHELGHGLIDLYDLPTTGREEDNADQLAAIILINGPDSADNQQLSDMLDAFGALANMRKPDQEAMADVHSLDAQRVYNFMCYLYGSDPKKYASVVGKDGLPKDRAEGCPEEYKKMADSWSTLLDPHIKDN